MKYYERDYYWIVRITRFKGKKIMQIGVFLFKQDISKKGLYIFFFQIVIEILKGKYKTIIWWSVFFKKKKIVKMKK